MTAPEVVSIGEVMGLVLAVDAPFESADSARLGYAGAEATVLVGLARLGHRVALGCRVGDDGMGRRITRALRAEGVDTDAVVTGPGPTGVLLRDAAVDRPIVVDYLRSGSAGSTLEPADLAALPIADAAVLHLTGITAALSPTARAAALESCRLARAAGTTVVLDPNVRRRLAEPSEWLRIVDELSREADAVLVGHDDLRALGIDGADWFHDRGVERVVVKSGAHGAVESDARGGRWAVPSRAVRVVDPVGAGDGFAAGWISAWLRGVDGDARLREAHAVASCVVGWAGDVTGLPSAAVRDAIVAETSSDVVR